jgi:hypothetical protein
MPGEKGKDKIYNAVNHDLKYFREYLLSNAGGEWEEDEIMDDLINPGSFGVIGNIASINADYSLVYFSGHGGEYRSRNQIIELADGEFEIVHLKTKSLKQLIIIDSCRVILDEETKKGFKKTAMVKSLDETTNYVLNSKQIFNEYLERCDNGIILLNAALYEQPAGCNQTESYLTSSLILAGEKWNDSLGGEEEGQVLDIWNATQNAQDIMNRTFVTDQILDCNVGRRKRSFPFAVRNCIL